MATIRAAIISEQSSFHSVGGLEGIIAKRSPGGLIQRIETALDTSKGYPYLLGAPLALANNEC